MRNSQATISLSEPPEFTSESFYMAFTVKPNKKPQIPQWVFVLATHLAKCRFDDRAGMNLIRRWKKLLRWTRLIMLQIILSLCSATKRPLSLDRPILSHLLLAKLGTFVWLKVAPFFVCQALVVIQIVYCFNRGIVSSDSGIVLSHSQPNTILVHTKSSRKTHITHSVL